MPQVQPAAPRDRASSRRGQPDNMQVAQGLVRQQRPLRLSSNDSSARGITPSFKTGSLRHDACAYVPMNTHCSSKVRQDSDRCLLHIYHIYHIHHIRQNSLCPGPNNVIVPAPSYTPTLESSLAGNLMARAPVKVRNLTTKQRIFMREKELGKVSLSLFFSNLFFLSFKFVI